MKSNTTKMKSFLLGALAVLLLPLGASGQQSLGIFRFDDIERYDPEIAGRLGITDAQMVQLQALMEERENNPDVLNAKEIFEASRGTDNEAEAKAKWQAARSNALAVFKQKVDAILTDEQKALIVTLEETLRALRDEIKTATEGIEDKGAALAKAREIWQTNTANFWAQAAAPQPVPSPSPDSGAQTNPGAY